MIPFLFYPQITQISADFSLLVLLIQRTFP
jgi:hypothetical protein